MSGGLIKAFEISSVHVQLQDSKGMSKSAIINKPSDPSLNVNLGCNLKYKPGDCREEILVTVEFLPYLEQNRISEDKKNWCS